MCGSQTLKQKAVALKLPWRPQDVQDSSAVSYLLRKTPNREWNQPRRKQFVAVNKDDKGVGKQKACDNVIVQGGHVLVLASSRTRNFCHVDLALELSHGIRGKESC